MAVATETTALHGLVQVAGALRSGSDLRATLDTVARTLAVAAGFRTVVINLHRPAHDDYEVVVVHGNEAAERALAGTASRVSDWEPLIRPEYLRRGAYFVPGDAAPPDDLTFSYVPDLEPGGGPDAWLPEDALFVPLHDGAGNLLGILSVDEPVSRRRPSDEQLDTLVAVSLPAALAVQSAQHAEGARRHRVAVEHLLRVSAGLAGCRTADEVLRITCAGIREALGFETVVVRLAERRPARAGGPVLRVRAAHGVQTDAGLGDVAAAGLEPLLAPDHLIEGCALVDEAAGRELLPPAFAGGHRTRRNGRGVLGWNHHWLVVPLDGGNGDLAGVVWVDDPADRLLPTVERLQALRAFANQAANALESVRRLVRLQHLADHDPLTGLRNRRGLLEHIDALLPGPVGVIAFDVDHFKRVNDRLGYEAGDAVLTTVARVLDRERRRTDLAARLGGEEFALVLPGAGEAAAHAVAERVRREVAAQVTTVPWGLTVSAGVATSATVDDGASELVRAANRALITAKRLGRDRCVVHAPDAHGASLEPAQPTGR